MIKQASKKELLNAIKQKDIVKMRELSHSTSIPNIVAILDKISINNILIFFRSLDTERMADIFEKIEHDKQALLIEKLSDEKSKLLFDELFVDELADLIEELPEHIVKKILKNTSKEKRKIINKILSYSDNDTGSIMSVDIIILQENWTIKNALLHIKKHNEDKEVVSRYYVANTKNELTGVVTIHDLAFAEKRKKVKSLMEWTPFLTTRLDKEDAALEFQKHDFSELPVVDSNKKLVGIVTSDDMLDVIVEEYTEDAQIAAGIVPIKHQSYLKTSVFKLAKSRFFWLFFLMFSATLSQFVLQSFIDITHNILPSTRGDSGGAFLTTAIITLLVSILPDISGTSGNAGTQSSTLITRALATGELTTKDSWKVLWKETRVGLLVGSLLGITNLIRLLIYYAIYGSIHNDFSNYTRDIWISLGASIAMLTVILISKIAGGLLPLLAVKWKMDPAIMSAPLLTTLIDSLSIAIFFSINIAVLLMAGY